MSLAGNLSDLSLPELLQVVALSRKTGALEICSEAGGVAWLGLRDGGIVRVALEQSDLDRDTILKRAGLENAESDVVEATLWDAAVQAILSIFDWSEGEFTFEPLDDPALQWRGPQGILLPSPLSPEFLALEGARLEDENAAQQAESGLEDDSPLAPEIEPPPIVDEEPPELDAEPEAEEPNAAEPLDDESEDDSTAKTEAARALARARAALPAAAADPDATMTQDEPLAAEDDSDEPLTVAVPIPESARKPAKLPPALICIDVDLPLLEKLKTSWSKEPMRVHIFQSANDGLTRFKQYVMRGEVPAVVLGSGIEDPLDARQGLGWRRFAGRLLAIAPRMRLVVLSQAGERVAAPGFSVLSRPPARGVTAADFERFQRALTDALVA
jgi:hypothetical protein